jgi:hypothetical protein
MNPSNLQEYTQKQIQDENVRMGEARCANESRAKSEAKFISAWNKYYPTCQFIMDGKEYLIPIPVGKSREDFVKHILDFFAK